MEHAVCACQRLSRNREIVAASENSSAKNDTRAFGVASIGRHAILYAVGNVLSKAVAFVMLPIYTRYLTPADYGVAALIEMTLDVIALLGGAQIAQGIFRFYHKAESDSERRAVVATALTTVTISYGLLAGGVFLAAAPLSRLVFGSDIHAGLIRLAAGSLALSGLIWVPQVLGRVEERSGLVVGANMLKLFVAVALNLLFVAGMRLGVRGIFLSTLGANIVVALWLGIWTIRKVGFGIDPALLRSLIRYGVPLIGVQAATFTMTFSDRYFLQAAGNEAMVGLYNLAYQFGFLMLMLGFVPIEMVWGPKRFEIARTPDPGPVLAKAFRLINVAVISIGVGIALFVSDVLRIMSTPPFHPAADVVPIILLAYVFHGWAMMHDIGVLVKERTEFLTVANWCAALVALAGFAILVPRFYAFGAATAAVLAFSVRWGLTYFFSQRLWKISYDWPPVLRLGAVGILVCLASALVPRMNLFASIAVHSLFLVAYCVIVWNARVLTADEKRGALLQARRLAGVLAARARGGSVNSGGMRS